ncbi:decarboxylating 6-phosphogluconate dehydrogenase [Microvirgula curvata]|uniref:Decarboxylating 6-phosphogluconate dehydrogenase n=2 Tax=Microvirgula aerodenitrificans TaxID=57480 RepID=A0A2S0PFI7_9NEIS|nr:decarboxylating 6-phosphogluconate dehydrogenase [Microvirgula aerodenitrificans]AVY96105.1 decarboxylating 6-phosphogluconate dehydrogenase [Microvirgula aerodenitrificans]
MDIGMVGLGRMGANMSRRLLHGGHRITGYDADPQAVSVLQSHGGKAAASLEALVHALVAPRVIWLMLPTSQISNTLSTLAPLLSAGDCVIDGGNTFYQDSIRRARTLGLLGLSFVDVGVSGGVWGRERGYCLMIGGEQAVVQRLEPLFMTLAPASGDDSGAAGAERGFLHCGPAGAGHFVKMVHNGIEYGVMAALAEGFDILRGAGFARRETVGPGIDPAHYAYDFNLADIAEVWRHGSVISSWLLDLSAMSLLLDGDLADFSEQVPDSGAGRWTVRAALDEGVPSPVLTAALYQRFSSRDRDAFGRRLLSALRYQFGGHVAGPGPVPEK